MSVSWNLYLELIEQIFKMLNKSIKNRLKFAASTYLQRRLRHGLDSTNSCLNTSLRCSKVDLVSRKWQ